MLNWEFRSTRKTQLTILFALIFGIASNNLFGQDNYKHKYTNGDLNPSSKAIKKKNYEEVKILHVTFDENGIFPTDEMLSYPNLEFVRVSRTPINWKTFKKGDSIIYPVVTFDSTRIKQLKKLKAMHFIQMDFKDFPEEILSAENLEILAIIRCKLGSIPPSIKRLNRLKWLDLEFNELTSLPSTIVELDSLRSFLVNDNRFVTFPFILFDFERLDMLNIGNWGYGQEKGSILFPYNTYENYIDYTYEVNNKLISELKKKEGRSYMLVLYARNCSELKVLKSLPHPPSLKLLVNRHGGYKKCL